MFLGSRWNFYGFLALLVAAQMFLIYLDEPIVKWSIFVFIAAGFALHKTYLIDLPSTKVILAFFEQSHPELCSWVKESAVLEATLTHASK
jgi:hypothetical protein